METTSEDDESQSDPPQKSTIAKNSNVAIKEPKEKFKSKKLLKAPTSKPAISEQMEKLNATSKKRKGAVTPKPEADSAPQLISQARAMTERIKKGKIN